MRRYLTITAKAPRLVLCSLLCCGSATAGPPLVTDDPGLAGAGTLEAIVAWSSQKRPGEKVVELPQLDLTYGLGRRLDIGFAASLVETRPGGSSSTETLPVTAGLKWQPWVGTSSLMFSVAPSLQIDTRNSNSRSIFLPVLLEGSAGAWRVGGEAGFTATRQAPDEWQAGLYATRPLGGRSLLLAEVWIAEVTEIDERDVGWTLGAEIVLGKTFNLLVSIGDGHSSRGVEPIDSRYFLGLQYVGPLPGR